VSDLLKDLPLVSVITPSWNRGDYLELIAKSLESQTYKNIEWLIADDGSTDNTEKIVENITLKYNFPITYIKSSLRVGKAVLDNILIEKSSGKYLLFNDSDDHLKPYAIEKLVRGFLLNEKKVKNLVCSIGLCEDTEGNLQTELRYKSREAVIFDAENINDYFVNDATILTKASVVKKHRFLEVDLVITESSFWMKIFKKNKVILNPVVMKTMDRGAENSVTFSKKIRYCRGFAYAIGESETKEIYMNRKLIERVKKKVTFFRYCIHGDISFSSTRKIWPIVNNQFISFYYLIGLSLAVMDRIRNKVEKTHVDFINGQRYSKISVIKKNSLKVQ